MKYNCVLLIFSLIITGCSATVNLIVQNEEKYPLSAKVIVNDEKGFEKESVSIGEIKGNTEARNSFKVKNGNSFKVLANIPESGIVYSGEQITVTGEVDPFKKEVVIKNRNKSLEDNKSFETLSRSFKNTGDDIGARPLDLQNALDTRFGALVVAIPSSNGIKGKILKSITPRELGVRMMTQEELRYPRTNETEQVEISGTFASKANANYGPIGNFGFAFDSESVYQMKWVLRGFGSINKLEDIEKSVQTQFNAMKEIVRSDIVDILRKNPTAKLYYINQMYVLERAEMFIKKARKVQANAEFDAANIVSGSAVYTFKEAEEKNNGYGPVAINYWGEELGLANIKNKDFTEEAKEIGENSDTKTKNLKRKLIGFFSFRNGPAKYEDLPATEVDFLIPTGNLIEFNAGKFENF